ncbi:hypothetical protein K493DRAFT_407593 [Basidiobolus meristosporus CBS 931.73]|uniref:Uncharacterized protein n=1 Tax=Basidiobolus meristosporus CBS 931.73 TaxID=1314790 RepID=A0A1Y1YC03_9FUNG|nr:hypothetical protein K493DRAFT_407593 [Basidiobolus meristosporus CBS 931.73]|eukprot:ORX95455.1 hypothetical protein K493DRAFT_407593 [Basidiobolus meristosporus CBS 931.73]
MTSWDGIPMNAKPPPKHNTKWMHTNEPTDRGELSHSFGKQILKVLSEFVLAKRIDGKLLLRAKPEDLRKAGANIKWCRMIMDALELEKKKRAMAKATRSQSRAGAHSPYGSASLCSEDETRSIFSEYDQEISQMSDEPLEISNGINASTRMSSPLHMASTQPLASQPNLSECFSEIIEKTIQEKLELQRAEFNQLISERLTEQKVSLENILHKLTHKEHDDLHEKLQQNFEEHQMSMKTTMQQQMSDYEQILREQTEDTLESQKFVLEKIIACKVEELKGLVSKESKHNGMEKWEELVVTIDKWKLEIQDLKQSFLEEREQFNGRAIWSRYFGFFLTGLATGSILGMLFLRYSR